MDNAKKPTVTPMKIRSSMRPVEQSACPPRPPQIQGKADLLSGPQCRMHGRDRRALHSASRWGHRSGGRERRSYKKTKGADPEGPAPNATDDTAKLCLDRSRRRLLA